MLLRSAMMHSMGVRSGKGSTNFLIEMLINQETLSAFSTYPADVNLLGPTLPQAQIIHQSHGLIPVSECSSRIYAIGLPLFLRPSFTLSLLQWQPEAIAGMKLNELLSLGCRHHHHHHLLTHRRIRLEAPPHPHSAIESLHHEHHWPFWACGRERFKVAVLLHCWFWAIVVCLENECEADVWSECERRIKMSGKSSAKIDGKSVWKC